MNVNDLLLSGDGFTVSQIVQLAISEANPPIKQVDISEYVGFSTPAMVYHIKMGKAPVPLDKAAKLAEALRLDPLAFWWKVFKQDYSTAYAELKRAEKSVKSKSKLGISP